MKVVLTEKPSVARDIAAYLGVKKRCDGYLEGNGYRICWAFGHLVSLKEPEDYDVSLKRWRLDVLPIIPKKFELKLVGDSGAQKQFRVIKKLFHGADELICATDAGREGELIFRYILEMSGCGKKPMSRLWLSSLTDEAIGQAFKAMRPCTEYDNLYYAARCRSEADWIVGMNGTRNMTVRFGFKGCLFSVGRVQTPVLAMRVRRDDEIRNFNPEPFWELFTKYRKVEFKYSGKRFSKKDKAEKLLSEVSGPDLAVVDVKSKKEKVQPPQLFDLTELQREMNKRHGMSAAATLKAAQGLYEQKALTYPRTDSRYLTADMKKKVPSILKSLRAIRSEDIDRLNLSSLSFTKRIVDDKKVSDHHAIIPTGKVPSNLSGPWRDVYDAVVTRTIAVFYPPCLKEMTTVEAKVERASFKARGVVILDPGWTILYPKKSDDEQVLPKFAVGESGVHEPFVKEGKTKPPHFFSESSLLGAMETAGNLVDDDALKEALKEKGIGTPSTRAAIIETLIRRGYIERQKKRLLSTDRGRLLAALIQDPNLKSPELTGEWESKLREIEKGKLAPEEFIGQISHFTKDFIFNSDLIKSDLSIFGTCPKCSSPLIKGKKGYGCSKWRDGCDYVFWPQYKGIVLHDEQVRRLLQKKILYPPVNIPESGRVVLSLSNEGSVAEISFPKK